MILSKMDSGREENGGNFKDVKFQLKQFITIVMIYSFTHCKSTDDIRYVTVWFPKKPYIEKTIFI